MAFRSSLFYLTLTLLTLILGILGLPLLLTFNAKIISNVGRVWGICALKLLKTICNLDYKIEGLENIPKSQSVIVAAKHSSAWETIFLLKLLYPASFILKRELVRIPIYGWYLPAMGMISISRSDKIQAIKKVIRGSKKRLSEGFNIIIFPEGSRSMGEVDVKPGIYSIHKNLKEYKVLPITHNSGNYFGGKGSFKIKSGTISVKIRPLIEFDPYKNRYLEKIRKEIN